MLSQVVELIESKRRFAITSHVRPDGDALGSSLGLYWLLRALDKEAEVIMRDGVPAAYRKLPGADEVRVTPSVDRPYDAVFVIECSDVTRPGLGRLEEQLVVNIDHHSTTSLFGRINWIDSTASAVGEMVYNLCKAIGVRVTREIAECVYTALITDTGSFHYSNTSERTFKVASELVRAGVNGMRSESLFETDLAYLAGAAPVPVPPPMPAVTKHIWVFDRWSMISSTAAIGSSITWPWPGAIARRRGRKDLMRSSDAR
jgi:phosphoesterase RecJ-like protein